MALRFVVSMLVVLNHGQSVHEIDLLCCNFLCVCGLRFLNRYVLPIVSIRSCKMD